MSQYSTKQAPSTGTWASGKVSADRARATLSGLFGWAIDRGYLDKQGLSPKALAGMISISGLYDLTPSWKVSDNQKQATEKTFGNDPAVLKQASPIHHVQPNAPPFLIANAFQDFTGFPLDARRFADALRSAGNKTVQQFMFKDVDHFTIVKLDDENNPVRRTILAFMGVKKLAQ